MTLLTLFPRGLLPVFTGIVLIFGLVGCAKPKSYTPTEAETFAMSVVNQRFVERDGRWLALETTSAKAKPRLIELNKPTLQFKVGRVTDTDRMNGITDRCTLGVFCEQFRYWNGTWSEWKAGTGKQAQGLVNVMTNGMLGYQYFQLEKKNGVWSIKGAKAPVLVTDTHHVQRAMITASGAAP